jgi:hypothetical protein
MQRNYYEVLRAMNDAPVEANGLYWFGVGLGQGAQLLHAKQWSGQVTTEAEAILVKALPSWSRHVLSCPVGTDDLPLRHYEMNGGSWVAMRVTPEMSYEAAMTLIGAAFKVLFNA